MRVKGIIPVLIAVSAVIGMMSFPVYADGLFSGTYTAEDFTFSEEEGVKLEIDVPDGDYTVHVKTGGDERTKANVYINGGERVKEYTLEPGETRDNKQPAVPKDGKITFLIKGEAPNVTEITVEQLEAREKADKPTIYIAGDSTAQTYNYDAEYPQTGWGQKLSSFFTSDIRIDNRSMMGRSSKTFNNDGSLDAILTEMHPGDFVFIQFGINESSADEPRYLSVEDYKKLIAEKYIRETEKRGGIPVLMTPTPEGLWDEENNKFAQTRKDYADAARELAKELKCRFIDVNSLTTDAWNGMGRDKALSGYFICEPLESKAHPAGTSDTTHLKDKGAAAIAGYIAEAIPETVPELKQYLTGKEVFTDISGHWAEDTIKALAEKGVVHGAGGGKFNPDGNVTRAELLKMVMDAVEIPGHAYRNGECLDVKQSDWYCYFVQSALDKGLIPPYMIEGGRTYHRETKILAEAAENREAVTAELYIYDAQKINDDGKMREAAQKFNGNKFITREEMASLIMSCISYKLRSAGGGSAVSSGDAEPFADEGDVDAHYANAVKAAHSSGYISGAENGKFMPKTTLTRAEAAVVISNLCETKE